MALYFESWMYFFLQNMELNDPSLIYKLRMMASSLIKHTMTDKYGILNKAESYLSLSKILDLMVKLEAHRPMDTEPDRAAASTHPMNLRTACLFKWTQGREACNLEKLTIRWPIYFATNAAEISRSLPDRWNAWGQSIDSESVFLSWFQQLLVTALTNNSSSKIVQPMERSLEYH